MPAVRSAGVTAAISMSGPDKSFGRTKALDQLTDDQLPTVADRLPAVPQRHAPRSTGTWRCWTDRFTDARTRLSDQR